VNRPFSALHARTFCHATEDLEKVRTALENTVGQHELRISKIDGHHGNPITILETSLEDMNAIDAFFRKIERADFDKILSSLNSRMDEGCNLFIRIDKQAAFKGDIRLGRNDDVVFIRIHVRSFPAKLEIASPTVRDHLQGIRDESG